MRFDEAPPKTIRPRGRPNQLEDPVFFRVRFESEKLEDVKELCRRKGIAFTEFIRRAVDKLYAEMTR